jgi:large subunit ribosomal protein L13
MKTHVVKAGEIERKWLLVDAENQILGRLATHVAQLLRGKGKAAYSTHLDVGDHVVVTNAAKVKVTGRKLDQKKYYRYSGYQSGLKSTSMRDLMATHPEDVVKKAVKGMVPHTKLGRQQLTKLHVYAGPEHHNQAQSPEPCPVP